MNLGWRDEQFAIRPSFFAPAELTVERSAAGLFGCPAYGVFVVGYVDDGGAPSHVWVGRRSPARPTWPGLLDCLAAGGVAAGEMPLKAARREAAEEAGIPPDLAAGIRPSGGGCYTGFDETGWALKRDVLYTFDLRCPPGLRAALRRRRGGLLRVPAGRRAREPRSAPRRRGPIQAQCRGRLHRPLSRPMRTVTSSFSPSYAGPSAAES